MEMKTLHSCRMPDNFNLQLSNSTKREKLQNVSKKSWFGSFESILKAYNDNTTIHVPLLGIHFLDAALACSNFILISLKKMSFVCMCVSEYPG